MIQSTYLESLSKHGAVIPHPYIFTLSKIQLKLQEKNKEIVNLERQRE